MPGRDGAPEWVVCAECHTRYEAKALGFCPRCGSTARGTSAAAVGGAAPLRRDPGRMRVQLGGVLLLLVGGLFLASSAYNALSPETLETYAFDAFASAQGNGTLQEGRLDVAVRSGDAPLAGANVTVAAGNATLAQGATGPDGRFNATLPGYAAVVVTVEHGGGSWQRKVLAPSGGGAEVSLDLAADPQDSGRVVGAGSLSTTLTVASLSLSLLLFLGGLAAVLVRWRGLALAGPLPLVALSLIFVLLFFNGPALLFLAMLGLPYALVLSGRSAFRRG